MSPKGIIFFILGWVCFVTGVIGVFVPVLPTTPLLLLATFLFARSSPRFHAWIQRTRVYQHYVVPFKESGGLPLGQKIRILLISFAIMGVSAWAVPRVFVWVILTAVALWLLYLMLIRIPTIPKNQE
jgi:uncharacterized membrane protein YbaN (DUF454 family)